MKKINTINTINTVDTTEELKNKNVTIIGAGLAGCEAAWQLAKRKIRVKLYEMKPKKKSAAHKSENLAELVCSNSFKAKRIDSASGLLKEEMRCFGSLLLECASACEVEAGAALAVDREIFSQLVTEKILNNPFIDLIREELEHIPTQGVRIVATGPLTSESLSEEILKQFGALLSFYDAAAPIVSADTIDMSKAFFASRYDKGDSAAYINCPLNEEEYNLFYHELINAKLATLHQFDAPEKKLYEACMPVEVMARRGRDTLRFGPMKPVGLSDPHDGGKRPYAVVQLRRENKEATMYNLVGFQTNLKFSEQKRVFSLIPALKNAEFLRYGVMHRNTFIKSPKILMADYSSREDRNLFFAGQITGVEGYMESASSGILAGINAASRVDSSFKPLILPRSTMMGALASYVSDDTIDDFQPMGANFGILAALSDFIKNKKERYKAMSEFALGNCKKLSK